LIHGFSAPFRIFKFANRCHLHGRTAVLNILAPLSAWRPRASFFALRKGWDHAASVRQLSKSAKHGVREAPTNQEAFESPSLSAPTEPRRAALSLRACEDACVLVEKQRPELFRLALVLEECCGRRRPVAFTRIWNHTPRTRVPNHPRHSATAPRIHRNGRSISEFNPSPALICRPSGPVKLASGVALGLPHLGPAPPSGTIRHDAHTVR
jgi:hypothetical protein